MREPWMARHLGLAAVHPQRGWEALKRLEWSLQAPRPQHPRTATPEQRGALKKNWARRAPRAPAHNPAPPRSQWLQVVAFVQPTSGETVWYLASGLSKPFFEVLLAAFARQVGAG